jgi:8-oxo-dGTP pyrophosphatase MutT (NUDIX family)
MPQKSKSQNFCCRQMSDSRKRNTTSRIQYAALPYRISSAFGIEVLLVTSRETKRWVIPKGWPIKRKDPWQSAAREATEEAGVVGKIRREPIGSYLYRKRLRSGKDVVCEVHVFPLKVKRQQKSWREQGERQCAWFPLVKAAKAVGEPVLGTIIRRLQKRDAS